jgi:flagellar hook assembly protein FlgD
VVSTPRTGIDDESSDLPLKFSLFQNYPNPFNPSTEIKFGLPQQSDVRIEIFNILGQRVVTLYEGLLPAGFHSVRWNGSSSSSGIYYYKIAAESFIDIKKMTLLK